MTALPRFVRRAPTLFYGLAGLIFISSFALSYYEISQVQMPFAEYTNFVAKLAVLKAAQTAAIEAIYVFAYGVLAHILLAIYQADRAQAGGGGDA